MARIAVLLMGPPGVGKGTQAKLLAEKFGFRHIATGDILREAVRKRTKLGKLAKSYMDKGQLVPDEVMLGLIDEVLAETDSDVILDGYPRTVVQAENLEPTLNRHGFVLKQAVFIDVPDDEIVRRLSARRICPKCGAVYNLLTQPPKNDEICDNCGTKLIMRDDDRPEVIMTRLRVYRDQTKPVLDYYKSRGLLKIVSGEGNIEEVHQRLLNVLGLKQL